jgi:hypothetical protein
MRAITRRAREPFEKHTVWQPYRLRPGLPRRSVRSTTQNAGLCTCPAEVRPFEVRCDEVRPAEIRPAKVRLDEVRSRSRCQHLAGVFSSGPDRPSRAASQGSPPCYQDRRGIGCRTVTRNFLLLTCFTAMERSCLSSAKDRFRRADALRKRDNDHSG